LHVRDIFDTGEWEFESSGEYFSTRGRFSREAPTVTMTLRYNINNYERERGREQSGGGPEQEGGGPQEF